MKKNDNNSSDFLSMANHYSMWLKKKKLIVILLMTISFVCAFSVGYHGVGSDIIIVDCDNNIDCFFRDNPTGLNLYLDCILMKQMLNSSTYETIKSNEYTLAFILQYHSRILQKISIDNKVKSPEIEELQKEISRCMLLIDKTRASDQNI